MTKTSEQTATAREQYYEDNPDAYYRPGLGKLMHKLRTISVLVDKPDSVARLIDDLAYGHLVRQPHPNELWYLMNQLHSYWRRAVGASEAEQLEWVQNAVTTEDESEKVSLVPWEEFAHLYRMLFEPKAEEKKLLPHEAEVMMARGKLPIRIDAEGKIWGPAGFGPYVPVPGEEMTIEFPIEVDAREPREGEAYDAGRLAGYEEGLKGSSTLAAPSIDLSDKELKEAVRKVIWQHTVAIDEKSGTFQCEGPDHKEFDMEDEWANHARIQVWKVLKEYERRATEASQRDSDQPS